MQIYAIEAGAKVCKDGGKINIILHDKIIASYPIECVDGVVISVNAQITSQCLAELSRHGTKISWIYDNGKIIGSLVNPYQQDVFRQQKQFLLSENKEFCLAIAQRFIHGKIINQKTFLTKKNRELKNADIQLLIENFKIILKKIDFVSTIYELLGLEGLAARIYYKGIRCLIPENFDFKKREKNPPIGMANSVLSFAYNLLFNDIFLAVYQFGYNPYIGFMHQCRQGHPALVSDLMEEWRTVVADAVSVKFLRKNKITEKDFSVGLNGGMYLNGSARKELIETYEAKVKSKCFYHQNGIKNDFRGGFLAQLSQFTKALELDNPDKYEMIIAR